MYFDTARFRHYHFLLAVFPCTYLSVKPGADSCSLQLLHVLTKAIYTVPTARFANKDSLQRCLFRRAALAFKEHT